MRIFITGAAGLVGTELRRLCAQTGIETVNHDISGKQSAGFLLSDIRSPDLFDLIPEGVDAIVHLAGLPSDDHCKDNAQECFDINVVGTLNVLNAARKKNVKQFIFASTEWVYDKFQDGVAKKEDDIIDIASLSSEYALSKLVTEANLRQQYMGGSCPITALRFGIIYGPHSGPVSAVEALLKAVSKDKDLTINSYLTGRCFIHVSDIASGIIASLGLPGFEIINLQGDRLITLGDIINSSAELLGKTPVVTETDSNSPSIRLVSNAKAKQFLDWTPEISFEDGLKSVRDYHNL